MKIFTLQPRVDLRYLIVLILSLVLQPVQAQFSPVYTNTISSQSNTDFSNNSIDGNLSTRARVRASSGIALNIGNYSGHLELKYPAEIPANTTTYIKIQTDDNLLPALLSGSLGGLVADVLGVVLLGNQEFTVQARNGNDIVLEGNSQFFNDFSGPRLRVVVNGNNEYFIAITPNQVYDRIRLTNRVGSLLGLFNTKRLDVFEAFYIGTPDACGGASFTSFDGAGLNLDLLNLGQAGVTNPHHVLDANPNNFSRLSLGVAAVASSVQQTVYFGSPSQTTDDFYIRMKVDPSLLALGVANNIQIIASNGPNTVQTINLNSLLNLDLLTLLQGNQVATIRYSPNASVSRITIRYSSLLNVQLTQSLDLYGISRAPALPSITDPSTLNATACSGTTASLIATTDAGNELRWYAQPQGGSILATTASGDPFVTPVLTQNTAFYVAAKRIGCPEESARIRINVAVSSFPTAADILIPDTVTACNGSVILSPSPSIGGSTFKYYKDQLKTQEITTGFAGDAGVTYTKNDTTGTLTITGLSQTNSPYSYYISIVNNNCENEANTIKLVTVNYSSALVLQVQNAISGCGSVNLRDAILNFDGSTDIQYNFTDASNNPISAETASEITASGVYSIQAVSLSGSCESAVAQVTVTVNPNPTLTIANTNLVANQGTTVTLDATSDGTIVWYDSNGNAISGNTVGPFTATGFYTFTAVASNANCSVSGSVTVAVIDPENCPPLSERVYAGIQSWSSILTGGVANAGNAIDANPQTYSTIVTGLGLLGIGTTWQMLQWEQTIPAGTPVSIKLGSEYSGAVVAGAYSVIGTKRNAQGIPVDIGVIQPVSASLVDLLPGQNTFEFTFVPSNNTGPKAYDGVRVIVGSVLSIAQNVRVYEAYYNQEVNQVACSEDDVEDVFFGAIDLGVGVANATVGVDNAFDAVDNNDATFATMFSGVGVLSASDLTVSFRTPTLPGDSLEMLLSRPATLLDVNLLTSFSIQLYLGNTPVGNPINANSTLLSLTLLNGGTEAMLTLVPQTETYDKVKIRFGGVASVLDFLRVHEINRKADTSIIGADPNNSVDACQGETISLAIEPDSCTTYIWYDAEVGGNAVSNGTSFTVPSDLASGTYTYYIQPVRFGCAIYERGTVTLVVGETAPSTAITGVSINGSATTSICTESGNVTLQASLNAAVTLTNPVFYWYASNEATATPIADAATATLELTGLAPGTYTYYVGISSDEYCQTALADRFPITFTILPFSQASDINIDDVTSCEGTPVVLTPTTTQANPQFSYFLTNDNTQPIVNGAIIDGATYSIAPNGTLTITGLITANSPYTFYVGVSGDASCLNQAGNLEVVTVTISTSGIPTTNDATQDFCQADAPTIADIQVNEGSVEFYTLPVGEIALPGETLLTDGAVYYGAFQATTGCVNPTRLEITVTVNDIATPTTIDITQDFCIADNPTIADIQVNESGISWYSNPNGGTALDSASDLVDDAVYYASINDTASGCQSTVRLAITVNLNDTATPSTNDTTQDFCQADNPTVADIQVNETGVVFYDVLTDGTPLAATQVLINGTYYASLTDAVTNCTSSVRLAIQVTVSNPAGPTTNDITQEFCISDNPTVADLDVNEPNVVFYDSPTAGTIFDSTAPLTNGGTYYASFNEVGTCVNAERLAIAVTLNSTAMPTTNDTTQDFCQADNPTIASIQVNESNVSWFATLTGGTALSSTTPLVDDATYYGAILNTETGCESDTRLAVTVNINTIGTPSTNDTTQDFCQADNPTITDIQVNESGVVFYTAPDGGTALSPTDILTSGTYYASLTDTATNCTSSVRLAIQITVSNPAGPTTSDTAQEFCISDNPTVADLDVNEPNVVFYDSPTAGTIFDSTAPLTNGGTYYASFNEAGTCPNAERLAITVTLNSTAMPTTNDTAQDFCQADNPTIASIQVNESNVSWFATPTGGTALASTTPLVDDTTYYGAILNTETGCESDTRLAVTVNINTIGTPSTNDTTQDFCQADNPTIADIQVNESGVVFYTVPDGGTALSSTDALVNGIYYASLTDSSTNCQSDARLAITVNISNPATPTTTNVAQEFCTADNPTIADIQVNETDVIFYDAPINGNLLSASTPLTEGIYYVAILESPSGCESADRLAITVAFSDNEVAVIVGDFENICVFEEVTYTANPGKTNYVWTVSNGEITAGGTTTDDFVTVSWNSIATGTVSVTYTDACSGTNSASLNVSVITCSDITISKTVNNTTPNIGDNVIFTIQVNNVGEGDFQNVIVNEMLPSGYAYVSSTASLGTYNETTGKWNIPTLLSGESAILSITVTVLATGNYVNTASIDISTPVDSDPGNNEAVASVDPICLVVYNEFSPNGDGNNELFRIDCLDKYPNNKLEVFNRYGSLVYSKNNYSNDWDGTSNVSGAINSDSKLPSGTYFYVLKTGTAEADKTGWLSIVR